VARGAGQAGLGQVGGEAARAGAGVRWRRAAEVGGWPGGGAGELGGWAAGHASWAGGWAGGRGRRAGRALGRVAVEARGRGRERRR
jgi:hypothetical protein